MLYGSATGYVCIAYMRANKGDWTEEFYQYPDELGKMLERIETIASGKNMYFCPQLLSQKVRRKEYVKPCPNIWSDLDTCDPEHLFVRPTVVIQSSPGRYQAYWTMEAPVEPDTAEDLARRIAYTHAEYGADKSGWDLTQVLRIPYTDNYKYGPAPTTVLILEMARRLYRLEDFSEYPDLVTATQELIPFPEDLEKLGRPDELLHKYRRRLMPRVWQLYQLPPGDDWSKALWELLMLLFEAELSREEAYLIAENSACNKWARDGRPQRLWKDVCRADENHKTILRTMGPDATAPEKPLLTDEERQRVLDTETFVERYIRWASKLGDAASQYHQAGAFTLLSSLVAGPVRLPTSFGVIIPNMWFMILADTTLTRKSTSMDIAMDLLMEVDSDAMLATDGSLEGLLTSLSSRPGRPSVFLRDEFTGLLEAMTKKDYMAGMAETLTKLYDGKYQKRILRKETIEVREPILNILAGGIRSKMQALLTDEHIASGFIPRFVFVTAQSDVQRIRPIGPPTAPNLEEREAIRLELQKIHDYYQGEEDILIAHTAGKDNTVAVTVAKKWNAELSTDAWVRYNEFEREMLQFALASDSPEYLTPVYDRLAKSGLRVAVLIAASRCESAVLVTLNDLLHAFTYVEEWRGYVADILSGIGKNVYERLMDKILNAIRNNPGFSRSVLMQRYHLDSRVANIIFDTLEQRALITAARKGRGTVYFPYGTSAMKPLQEPTADDIKIRV
ncbi:MAG TPA: DUF3987 domain-containing protein [Candidatus Acidoferrum sp.]|nr:DUF3987 domain-containing protein [Candidatus Acidoferrum sp.]